MNCEFQKPFNDLMNALWTIPSYKILLLKHAPCCVLQWLLQLHLHETFFPYCGRYIFLPIFFLWKCKYISMGSSWSAIQMHQKGGWDRAFSKRCMYIPTSWITLMYTPPFPSLLTHGPKHFKADAVDLDHWSILLRVVSMGIKWT